MHVQTYYFISGRVQHLLTSLAVNGQLCIEEDSYASVCVGQCLFFNAFLSFSVLLSPSGSSRNARASLKAAERILQKLRGRTEFTLLLTLKQEKFSSGVLLSIHYGEQRCVYCIYISTRLSIHLLAYPKASLSIYMHTQKWFFSISLLQLRCYSALLSVSLAHNHRGNNLSAIQPPILVVCGG